MNTLILINAFALLNSPIIPAAIAVGGILYFGLNYYKANKIANQNRKEVQKALLNDVRISLPHKEYYVASAGSRDTNACEKISAIDINNCNLCDSEGKPLDTSKYECFVVSGDSMRYAGINNKDFILVTKDFSVESLSSLPEILVVRYREQTEGKPLYKVRRAWHKGSVNDNLRTIGKEILKMPKFDRLMQLEGFRGTDWMLDDLIEKRFKHYQDAYYKDGVCPKQYERIIISTTFDSIKKEIHFSIHPLSAVVGIVKESYSIN